MTRVLAGGERHGGVGAAGRRSRARWPSRAGPARGAGRVATRRRGAGPAAATAASTQATATEPACPSPRRPGYSRHRLPERERCAVRRAVRCGAGAAGRLLRRVSARRAAVELARGAGAGPPCRRAARWPRRPIGARELSDPGPRLRLLPGAGRRGADRAAPPGQGRRAATWKCIGSAPDRSKQVILGWRDGAFLPTDIDYHRDHLGIVTNNFGDVIRIGEGDEVRDVPHPLSPAGPRLYDYALGDSLAIRTAAGETVGARGAGAAARLRPAAGGRHALPRCSPRRELVRFRFSFTPAAYLDRQLEDISIVLENSLFEQRYWLPYRQEIEIRRRTTWLDFPARGIIRGRWEIDDYDLNVPLPAGVFAGPAIGGPGRARTRTTRTWTEPLGEAIAGVAPPVNRQDMDALRVEVERIAGARALSGLPASRLAAGSMSDVVHVNRVQGLRSGSAACSGCGGSRVQVRPWLGYGTSDERVTGGLCRQRRAWAPRRSHCGASGGSRDFSDLPVIAPVLNSLLAQEGGKDYGDYVLLDAARLGLRHRLGGRTTLSCRARGRGEPLGRASGPRRPRPLPAQPAARPGTYRVGGSSSSGPAAGSPCGGICGTARGGGRRGPGRLRPGTARGPLARHRSAGHSCCRGGYSARAPTGCPPHRSFVLGGRGTLVGEPFRAYGGRERGAGRRWNGGSRRRCRRFRWARSPRPAGTMTVAPFVAAGWAGRPLAGLPWDGTRRGPSGGRRGAGVAHAAAPGRGRVGLRDGGFGVTVDMNRDWWGVL